MQTHAAAAGSKRFLFVSACVALAAIAALIAIGVQVLGRRSVARGMAAAPDPAPAPADTRRVPVAAAMMPASVAASSVRSAGSPMGRDPALTPEQSAKRRAEARMLDLERSGPARSSWASTTTQAIEAWKATSPLGYTAEFGAIHCVARGCAVTITRRESEQAAAEVPSAFEVGRPAFWTGAMFRSGEFHVTPEKLRSTWIFYKTPDDP